MQQEYLVRAPYFFLKLCQIVYSFFVHTRYLLYKLKLIKVYKSSKKIISVGNLSVGGTGKTPFTIWLANNIQEQRACILLRGYKAKQKITSPIIVDYNQHTANAVGDEALLIAQRVNIPVIVCPNRVKAINYIEDNLDIDIIILDDAFQNIRVARDENICLIDCSDSLGDKVLPVGSLREEFSQIKRASKIILTRSYLCPDDKLQALIKKIRKYNEQATIEILQESLNTIKTIDGVLVNQDELKNKIGIAFCGLGNPQQFFELLKKSTELKIKDFISFPDHYSYKSSDIEELIKTQADYYLTTAKDAVKLQEFIAQEIYYIEYKIDGLETI